MTRLELREAIASGDTEAQARYDAEHQASLASIATEAAVRRDYLNSLNLKRKGDRAKLAQALEEIAKLHGATIERSEGGPYLERGIRFGFYLNGSGGHLQIDGDSSLDVPLISWVASDSPREETETRSGQYPPERPAGRCFSSNFENCARANRSCSQPNNKATSCPRTIADLVNDLDGGLGSMRGGSHITHFIHPWAADTAYFGAGSPTDRPKAQWIAEYTETGIRPSVAPCITAARAAFEAAGGWENFTAADIAAQAAYKAVKEKAEAP